jgi:aminodeoxyfutalosine deaminase
MGRSVSAPRAGKSNCRSQAPGGMDIPVLHRAAWLIPVVSPPLSDGAVLVGGSRILAAGSYAEVRAVSPLSAKQVDHGSAAIMPGLVNAHTHLELTGLLGQIDLPKESFAQWLKEILSLRSLMTPELQRDWLRTGQEQLLAAGCCLCGDITNGTGLDANADGHTGTAPMITENCGLSPSISPQHPALSTQHSTLSTQHPLPTLARQVFLELLGFDRESLADCLGPDLGEVLGRSTAGGLAPSLAAHACYSTSGRVIREAKEWCRARRLPFSIHAAEHVEEVEFLERGAGFCREVLENLGRWTPDWAPPGTTPVRYLEHLQVLDAQTLLVQAVHLTDADWEIVLRTQCAVCFCPRSNRNLNVGRPELAKALRSGVVAALGTDSLASNTDLSLFAEAAYVLDNYAEASPEAIVLMMTRGGARALGQEQQFGSIAAGKRADLLVVSLPESVPFHRLYETIIQQGSQRAWRWAHHPTNGCA